ncbi:MAG: SH3 domain-containing protein, partial [Lachnospiraceae bacterium]|nr:SH3 domain-containing protein [Lachnospiraceae bacterium]
MKKFIVGILSLVLAGAVLMAPAHTYESKAFTEEEVSWIAEAKGALSELLEEKDIMALVYLADEYTVRSEASQSSGIVTTVPSGQLVMIQDVEMTENYEAWVKVSFTKQEQTYTGYVERGNLACSDELFLQWEMDYGMNPASYAMMSVSAGDAVSTHADIEQFPESYQAALTALKEAHPNWVFVKMETGLEWDTVVSEELKGGRSLIPASLGGYLQEGKFSSGWSYATEEALEYYLDPRNGLSEKWIFQFEQLTFNESYHMDCEAAVQRFLDNTFMKGEIPQAGFSYAYGFWIIGKEMNISPFHLASRVYQEQGKGTSPLISGTYPGYEGYYNYFNI